LFEGSGLSAYKQSSLPEGGDHHFSGTVLAMKIENQQIEVKDETTAPSSSSAGLQVEEKRRRAWEQVRQFF